LGSWSVLGLPSSFTGRPYSLTAIAVSQTEVAKVAREDFLRLMGERPDLCREAVEMLAKEMSFIQSALVERQKKDASLRTTRYNVAVG
jgi:CRP-like cAMP-binding protein